MFRFILVTFALLAWAFYELSGGADFDPGRLHSEAGPQKPLEAAAAEKASSGEVDEATEVTRVSLDLTSVEDVVSGGGASRVSTRLPQQSAPASEAQDSRDLQVMPSLIENARPENVLDPAESGGATVSSFETVADIRLVDGNRVNVRGGPGTNYGIVDTLSRGARVEILDDTGNGWVRMRSVDSGTMGWMADFLLTDS